MTTWTSPLETCRTKWRELLGRQRLLLDEKLDAFFKLLPPSLEDLAHAGIARLDQLPDGKIDLSARRLSGTYDRILHRGHEGLRLQRRSFVLRSHPCRIWPTISIAISVARCRSSAAPVETSPSNIKRSAARPPIKTAIRFLSSLTVSRRSIFCGPLHRVAKRADTPRNDGDLLHGIDAGQARGDQSVPHLVIGGPPAFALAQRPALLFDTGDDPLDRGREVIEVHSAGIAPRRGDRRLVDQVGKIGAGETGRKARDLFKVHIETGRDLLNMNLEDGQLAGFVGTIDQHLPVKATGTKQGRIQNLRPIGGGQKNNAGARVKSSSARSWLRGCSFSS